MEFDILNNDLTIDPTPYNIYDHHSAANNAISTYIADHGVLMEHGLQSIPWMVKTAGKNTGEFVASMPGIPWQFYENGVSILDDYEITINSTDEANEDQDIPIDNRMKFTCSYDESIADPGGDPRGQGSDRVENWGPVSLNPNIRPFLHHNWYPESGTLEDLKPVIFYGGNWTSSYDQNVKWPYMYPILMIQGTKKAPIAITLMGWTFAEPYYKQGIANNIEPGYANSNHSLYNIKWWQYSNERQYTLEHWLYNMDADSSLDFLQNKLFIKFGQWAEDIDPFDGWGDPEDEDNPSGGDGDGMLDNETIPVTVPEVSAFNKFFTCYKLSSSQLNDLADFCWSPGLIDNIKKFYTSPADAILGLMYVPFTAATTGSREIYIGNVPSGVYGDIVGKQFQYKSCGYISIPESTRSYLDYDPYTSYSIMLPFIGCKQISADDIVGKSMGVTYAMDMLSGGCAAHITVNGSIRYTFTGSCGIQVPVTSQNLGQGVVAAAIAASSMSAAAAAGPAAGVAGAAFTGFGMSNSGGAMTSTSAMAASLKPAMSRGGSASSCSGWLSPGKPFLIVKYPNIAKNHNQQTLEGYPTFRGTNVGDFSGYTQFDAVKLKASKATQEEQQEIIRLLKGGVFL